MKQPDVRSSVTKRVLDVMDIIIASEFEPEINSQADFAKSIHMHAVSVSRMISGSAQATVEMIHSICTRYKVSANYILLGKGDAFLPGTKIEATNQKIENHLRELSHKMDILIGISHSLKHGTETRNKGQKLQLKRAR